jgi:hypothetical protein
MRDPKVDVYVCLVNFVGTSGAVEVRVDQTGPVSAHRDRTGADRVQEDLMPSEYSAYAEVASEEDAKALAEHGPNDLTIDLTPGGVPPYHPLYNLSRTELELLREYLEEYVARGWIRRSKSSAGAPILFAKKKDGSMRLCVDYRGLNKVTIKNRHPLPLIMESLDRLSQAKYFTKLDVREAYHRVRIREGDEWKTAFRTRYGHFEYTVMPFGLTNAPAQFQALINETLQGLVDVSCIVYLDDILIFSDTMEQHTQHVKEILNRLRNARLYIKLSKCEWHTQRTEYLGYVISPDGVSIDEARVKTIQEWPQPRTVRDIRVFIGFMNYYRRFINGFSKLALPLTILTQKKPGSAKRGHEMRKEESQRLEIGAEGQQAFQKLKDAFLGVPILCHFEADRKTKVEVDASGGAISGILSQMVPDEAGRLQWRPVDFYSRKLIAAEYNYDTHDQELLAIVKSLEHWRHYLEGIHFEILTDHQNLKWFMETKTLNHRQVRSYLVLSRYDFVLNHRPGVTNPADGPSRRPDYMAEAQKPSQKYNEAFVEPMRDILSNTDHGRALLVSAVTTRSTERSEAQSRMRESLREFQKAERARIREPEASEEQNLTDDAQSNTSDESEDETGHNGPVRSSRGQNEPRELTTIQEKADALRECHDDPLAGHFGARRTLEKVQRRYAWIGMRKDVTEYCKDCLVCRLTKMAHYIPARGDWDGVDLAQAWIREVIRLHGVPVRVISDRGPLMNAKHWDTFNHYLNSRRVLTSAFHPQTDGQTERQNQTLETYLRCFCSLEQDDWALWIAVGEYAYNDSVHSTTGTTPFRAYYGIDPRGADWPSMPLGEGESPLGGEVATKVLSIQRECKRKILAANAYQKEYADKKRTPFNFKVGDRVLVSSRNMRSSRPKRKLDWKYVGPGTILAQYGPSAFKVDLSELGSIHPVFHASLLEPYSPTGTIPHPDVPIVDTLREYGDDVYEVEAIIDRRLNKDDHWEYLVKWTGYPEEENSWEPGPNISAKALKQFWDSKGIQPRRRKRAPEGILAPPEPKKRRGRPPKKKGDEGTRS